MEMKPTVVLVSHTPDPEETVSAAARLCYSPADIGEIMARRKSGDRQVFLEKLISMGHLSPLEHASFTFAVEGISRACSHQLVRHRLASYSQQSQRYVGKEEGFRYVVPPVIAGDAELSQRFGDLMETIGKSYKDLATALMEKGRSREEAREDARFVLPNAAETKIFMTMNGRELLHFFSQRLCLRAQWEIRRMATMMLRLAKSVAPVMFRNAGPRCITGACPEGARGCGKAKEVRAYFSDENFNNDKGEMFL